MIDAFTFYDYLDLILSSLYLSGGVCCLTVLHPTPPANLLHCVLQAFSNFSLIRCLTLVHLDLFYYKKMDYTSYRFYQSEIWLTFF